MNEHHDERILLAAVAVSVVICLAVGLAIPESHDATVAALVVLLVTPLFWSDKIAMWMDRKSQNASSFGWYVFWQVSSLPFTTAYFLGTGMLPERSS